MIAINLQVSLDDYVEKVKLTLFTNTIFSLYWKMMDKQYGQADSERYQRRRRIITLVGTAVILAMVILLSIVFGRRIMEWINDPMEFREWAQSKGIVSRLTFIGLFVLQIVLAFIPGGPLEIVAGVAFGTWQGFILTMIGAIIGSAAVFLFIKRFGWRFAELFVEREKIEALPILNNRKQFYSLLFLLFFIPGTPKDVMCYAAPFTGINLLPFLLISSIARVPFVLTSTWGGSTLTARRLDLAFTIFGITAAVTVIGMVLYRRVTKKGRK